MGTVINVIAIIMGSLLGLALQSRFSQALKDLMIQGIGLVTILLGIQLGLKTGNILIPFGAILIGGAVGYFLRLDERLDFLSKALEKRFARKDENSRFAEGFITASLLYCVGPMAVLGSINDGLYGDYQLLSVKAALDGFASVALAASLGSGVLFSFVPVLLFQGGLTLLAFFVSGFFTTEVINETTAAGGIIIIGLGLVILQIRKIKVADFLPALFIVPLIVKLLEYFTQ